MKKLSQYDWYCDECNDYLNGQIGFDAYCGHWTCTSCGHVNKIGKSEILFDTDIDTYIDDSEEMPFCCSACGNPAFPNCKTSCKIFDD